MKKILLVGSYPDFVLRELSGKADVVHRKSASKEELKKEIKDAYVLVVRTDTNIDKDVIGNAGRLKLVVTATHGFEHVDTEELERKGIRFLTTPAGTHGVAEFTFLLMLSVFRKILKMDRDTRAGRWEEEPGRELHGKAVWIVR